MGNPLSGKHRAKCFSTGEKFEAIAIGKERKEQRGRRDLIRKRSTSAAVIPATSEYSFKALPLQSGLYSLINPPSIPMKQVLVSPFYRWIKC